MQIECSTDIHFPVRKVSLQQLASLWSRGHDVSARGETLLRRVQPPRAGHREVRLR